MSGAEPKPQPINRRRGMMQNAVSAVASALGMKGAFGLEADSKAKLREALANNVARQFQYRAAHALRPTPPRQRANIRALDLPNGETVRLDRGERKRLQRARLSLAIKSGSVSLSTPPHHQNRRSLRA